MFGRFLPREISFFDFFEKHAALTIEAAQELVAQISKERNTLAETNRIKALEHEADNITHLCLEALHKTFITPIERDDIHHLISRMDDVTDCIDAVADCIVIYKITQMNPEVKQLAHILFSATQEIAVAVKGLRNMKNAAAIRESCTLINKFENEADSILRNAIGRLFDEEQDTRLIIKWKEIYETLEEATDRCEDVANVIESVILEYD
jgi:uncharacterized protein